MKYHSKPIKSRFLHTVLAVCVIGLATYLASQPASAANQIHIDVIESGTADVVDTIFVGLDYELRIWIENDVALGAMSTGFVIYSDDGVSWSWTDVGGYGPDGLSTGKACVTVESGSRMDPPANIWNIGDGFSVTESDVDGSSPDLIMFGGAALGAGLPSGSSEHMVSFHFQASGPTGETVGNLCVDSSFVPTYGYFVYSNTAGTDIVPAVTWLSGDLCWPVKEIPNSCVSWDPGLPTTMDVQHCGEETVTLTASDPESDPITFQVGAVTGGAGTASIVDHGGGEVALTYTADPSDVGNAITVDVDVADPYHPYGMCPSHTVSVNVTNNSPLLSTGWPTYQIYDGYPVTKRDIVRYDADDCDNVTFSLVSPPDPADMSIDPSTGEFQWSTSGDVGSHVVTVEVNDTYQTSQDVFTVIVNAFVPDTCDPTIQMPGDANNDGNITSGDLVFMNNWFYQGGPEPAKLANADVNGDCFVDEADFILLTEVVGGTGTPVDCTCLNPYVCFCDVGDADDIDFQKTIADAVWIINLVFKGGGPPTPYPLCSGDANLDCSVNISDAVLIINWVFKGGTRPAHCREWVDIVDGCGWIPR